MRCKDDGSLGFNPLTGKAIGMGARANYTAIPRSAATALAFS